MRRVLAVLLFGALAFAMRPQPAVASSSTALPIPTFDFKTQLLQRFYGETGDAAASLAASFGDTASESPLRWFAFRLSPPQIPSFAIADRPDAPLSRLELARYVSTPAFDATSAQTPTQSSSPDVQATATVTQAPSSDPAAAPVLGYYRGYEQPPAIAASQTVHLDLITPRIGGGVLGYAPAAPLGDTPSVDAATATVRVPVRVGAVNFQGRVEGGQSLASDSPLHSNSYAAGANFNVQAGKRAVNVDVASKFEHLSRNDTPLAQSFDGVSNWQLTPTDNLPVLVPAFADVSKHTISAGVAVPVTGRLTAGVQYDAQHLLGGYGSPGVNNLDANNYVYGARLTYQLRNSAITFSAKQYRYQDNLIPANTFLQTREDVNLTVKF